MKTRSLTSQRFEIVTHFCDLSIEDDQFEEPFNSKNSKESIERNTIDENQLDK